MTIHRVYSLHDSKAAVYNMPFSSPNDALARRMVEDLVVDRNTTVGRHPSDFRLYCIGLFDDEKGLMQPFNVPEHIVDAVALVRIPSGFDLSAGIRAPRNQTNGVGEEA